MLINNIKPINNNYSNIKPKMNVKPEGIPGHDSFVPSFGRTYTNIPSDFNEILKKSDVLIQV